MTETRRGQGERNSQREGGREALPFPHNAPHKGKAVSLLFPFPHNAPHKGKAHARLAERLPAHLRERFVTLLLVAGRARGDAVCPREGAALGDRDDVIHRELAVGGAAVPAPPWCPFRVLFFQGVVLSG